MRAAPERSAAPLLDLVGSMLQDTTGQHRAHLFDLNCKICTGEHIWGETVETLLGTAAFEPSCTVERLESFLQA